MDAGSDAVTPSNNTSSYTLQMSLGGHCFSMKYERAGTFMGHIWVLPAPGSPDINSRLGWAGHVWDSVDIVEKTYLTLQTSFADYFSFAETAVVCCEDFRDLEVVGKCHDKVGHNEDGDGGRLQDEQSHLPLAQRANNLELCVLH